MEDIDGGLHPTVDGQSLDEDEANCSFILLNVLVHKDLNSAQLIFY